MRVCWILTHSRNRLTRWHYHQIKYDTPTWAASRRVKVSIRKLLIKPQEDQKQAGKSVVRCEYGCGLVGSHNFGILRMLQTSNLRDLSVCANFGPLPPPQTILIYNSIPSPFSFYSLLHPPPSHIPSSSIPHSLLCNRSLLFSFSPAFLGRKILNFHFSWNIELFLFLGALLCFTLLAKLWFFVLVISGYCLKDSFFGCLYESCY